MELANRYYNKKESNMMNRYRLYLQVISFYDLLTYNGDSILPEYAKGIRPDSRKSVIFWVEFPKPPKKYRTLWQHFITTHLNPIVPKENIQWNTSIKPYYKNKCYYLACTETIYFSTNNGYTTYTKTNTRRHTLTPKLKIGSTITTLPDDIQNHLCEVDVHLQNNITTLLSLSSIKTHSPQNPQPCDNTLQHR